MSTKGRYRFTVPFEAGAALKKHRIVKHGDADAQVIHAVAGVDPALGVTDRPAPEGETVDVCVSGIVAVEYGGAVTRGAWLGAGADGKAVEAERPRIQSAVVDGAAANTDITVTGIGTGDALAAVVLLDGDSSASHLPEASIHAAGTIRITNATTSKKLLVVWRTPAAAVIGRALVAGADGDIGQVLLAPGAV